MFDMKVKNEVPFWRGFGSVLTATPHRNIQAVNSADASVEASKMIARAWENVGSNLKGAMDGFEREQQAPRVD
jgi:hypothetical protein